MIKRFYCWYNFCIVWIEQINKGTFILIKIILPIFYQVLNPRRDPRFFTVLYTYIHIYLLIYIHVYFYTYIHIFTYFRLYIYFRVFSLAIYIFCRFFPQNCVHFDAIICIIYIYFRLWIDFGVFSLILSIFSRFFPPNCEHFDKILINYIYFGVFSLILSIVFPQIVCILTH